MKGVAIWWKWIFCLRILTIQVINIISVSLPNLPSNIKWIIGNIGQFGYYRMNYDTETWENIIQQLKTNHLVSERFCSVDIKSYDIFCAKQH